jgi:hypothetical protein
MHALLVFRFQLIWCLHVEAKWCHSDIDALVLSVPERGCGSHYITPTEITQPGMQLLRQSMAALVSIAMHASTSVGMYVSRVNAGNSA